MPNTLRSPLQYAAAARFQKRCKRPDGRNLTATTNGTLLDYASWARMCCMGARFERSPILQSAKGARGDR